MIKVWIFNDDFIIQIYPDGEGFGSQLSVTFLRHAVVCSFRSTVDVGVSVCLFIQRNTIQARTFSTHGRIWERCRLFGRT